MEVADGFLKIAVENMANAIKKVSVQRGYDVTGYTLNCFGGAGGQHACLVADALGLRPSRRCGLLRIELMRLSVPINRERSIIVTRLTVPVIVDC